jgi:hypothetical protein
MGQDENINDTFFLGIEVLPSFCFIVPPVLGVAVPKKGDPF